MSQPCQGRQKVENSGVVRWVFWVAIYTCTKKVVCCIPLLLLLGYEFINSSSLSATGVALPLHEESGRQMPHQPYLFRRPWHVHVFQCNWHDQYNYDTMHMKDTLSVTGTTAIISFQLQYIQWNYSKLYIDLLLLCTPNIPCLLQYTDYDRQCFHQQQLSPLVTMVHKYGNEQDHH